MCWNKQRFTSRNWPQKRKTGTSLRSKKLLRLEIFWMNNRTITVFGFLSYNKENYAERGGRFPPLPSTSAADTLPDVHTSAHYQPHSIIGDITVYKQCFCYSDFNKRDKRIFWFKNQCTYGWHILWIFHCPKMVGSFFVNKSGKLWRCPYLSSYTPFDVRTFMYLVV